MRFDLQSPRNQLVQIMNRIYYGGLTTLSGGNLSILDDDGDLWITPSRVDKGKLTPADIVQVGANGQVTGLYPPSTELPFHRAIYQRRPDIRAIVHAHAPALVSFSVVRKIPDANLIPQAQSVCGRVGCAPYALPSSDLLGENVADLFAQGNDVVLLENHGAATGGATLLEAFQRVETLDFCARTQIVAQALGHVTSLTDDQIALVDHRQHLLPEFTPRSHSSWERDLRGQIVEFVQRACGRRLMISTEGVVSARVDRDSFLITPTGFDRPSIEHEDVVLIRQGQREAGKNPSRSVRLHELIYQQHPDVNCIITAQPPYAMAYAISGHPLDTRTIPESYILLLDVPNLAFGAQYTDPAAIAAVLSPQCPVLMLRNDCVLTTGANILQAFDRLEVLEFTARSLFDTASIGALVPICEEEIDALTARFLS